jgi:transcription termination factor Rho
MIDLKPFRATIRSCVLMPMGVVDAMELLLDKLRSSRTNAEFFEAMNA